MMLKLKLQYFGHLMRRVDSLEKTLILGGIGGRRRRGQQRMRWLDGVTNSMDVSLSELRELVMDREAWRVGSQRIGHDWATELNWTEGVSAGEGRRNWKGQGEKGVYYSSQCSSIPMITKYTIHKDFVKSPGGECACVCACMCMNWTQTEFHMRVAAMRTEPMWEEVGDRGSYRSHKKYELKSCLPMVVDFAVWILQPHKIVWEWEIM